jgi:hypothetical protein
LEDAGHGGMKMVGVEEVEDITEVKDITEINGMNKDVRKKESITTTPVI